MEKKTLIYKNDLKFNNNNIYENSDFDSDVIKDIYNDYKKKPKIELRIKDCEMENYNYLDLSDLNLDNELLEKLINLDKIKFLLNKIKFLDLSSNQLTKLFDFSLYKNILYLNIARNKIEGNIDENNIIELSIKKYLTLSKLKKNILKGYKVSINLPEKELLIDPYIYGKECLNDEIPFIYKYNSNYVREKNYKN